jgi:hypothetical protein
MRTNDRTPSMSPRRSAAARFRAGSWHSLRSASRCRRRALVHARQVFANPSDVRPEPLKAATDKLFRQRAHVFFSIMRNSLLGPALGFPKWPKDRVAVIRTLAR